MKKHLFAILIALLFLTGLSVLLYPAVSHVWNTKRHAKAVASYMERMEQLDTAQNDALLSEAKAYNEAIRSCPDRFMRDESEWDDYLRVLGTDNNAVGYLEIERIQARLPVYLGDSEAVLQMGIGTLPGASLPVGGAGTHAVLTGHRGLPASRLLTDLDRVQEGDVFVLHILNQTLTYQVDQIRIVEPHDFTQLEIMPDQDLCTLVTCTPYGINSHRLLVRGRRMENKGYPVTADAARVDPRQIIPFAAAPILLVLAVTGFVTNYKKP